MSPDVETSLPANAHLRSQRLVHTLTATDCHADLPIKPNLRRKIDVIRRHWGIGRQKNYILSKQRSERSRTLWMYFLYTWGNWEMP